MIYKLCRDMILDHRYSTKEEMINKLNVFHRTNRITLEQYNELTALLDEQ